MRKLTLFAWLLALVVQLHAATTAPEKVDGLKLELIPDQPSYELGAPVTATLRYTYTGTLPMVIHEPLNDVDRMEGLSFSGVSPDGKPAADPLTIFMTIGAGQHFGAEPLLPGTPHTEKIIISEWLLFDQPGQYKVTVQSTLAAVNEFHLERDQSREGGRVVTVESEPLVITITPSVEANRVKVLAQARADLAASETHLHLPSIERLRYLRDARAIPLLIEGLNSNENEIPFESYAGLYAQTDPQLVKAALLKHVDEMSEPPGMYAQWVYAVLLAHADSLAPAKPSRFPSKAEMNAEERWSTDLRERFSRKVMARSGQLSSEESVRLLLQGLDPQGYPTGPTLEQKRFILQHVAALKAQDKAYHAAGIIQNFCKEPALKDDLKSVAANPQALPDIRSAAMVALHDMGDDEFRDVIAHDLMSPKPELSDDAHAMIGAYKQAEIGRALLALLEDKSWEIGESAADRLTMFGQGITAKNLDQALVRLAKAHELHDSSRFRAVYALAVKSPKLAIALIKQVAEIEGEYNSIHDPILCRVNEGRPVVMEVLRSGSDYNRAAMLKEFQQAWWEIDTEANRKAADAAGTRWPNEIYNSYSYRLPLNKKLIVSYAPEFLRIAKAEPNNEVRMVALQLLAQICEVPPDHNQWAPIHPEQVEAFLPQWEKWLKEHPVES